MGNSPPHILSHSITTHKNNLKIKHLLPLNTYFKTNMSSTFLSISNSDFIELLAIIVSIVANLIVNLAV